MIASPKEAVIYAGIILGSPEHPEKWMDYKVGERESEEEPPAKTAEWNNP